MKSLLKALDILELFRLRQNEMSLGEMSDLSGYNKSTVYRIVSTLTKCGYLRQQGKRGKYSLGTIFIEFSGIIKGNVSTRDIAIPYLIELSRLVKESVMIALWDEKHGGFTETFHETNYSRGPLKFIPEQGTGIPLYCTCLGKIFLASMSGNLFTEYINSVQLEKRTPHSIVDVSILKNHLPDIRRENVAYDDEEYTIGVSGVASGIIDAHKQVIGAIAVIGPSVRLSNDVLKNDIAPIVHTFARRISIALGCKEKDFKINIRN